MRQIHVLASLLFLLLITALALSMGGVLAAAQPAATPTPQIAFSIEGEIGRALPRKMVYDAAGEQMAVVDAYNRLLLINALDYSTRAVLHERGSYGDITFSDDGRWLAVIYDLTVEVWDTTTQQRVAQIAQELGSARSLTGPLDFTTDNHVLLFYGIYPAPPALRRTENDTITYPWMWHVAAARGEAVTTFPDGATAVQMFDYANGFVLTPDDRIVAALPARLQVLDAYTLEPQYEIATERYEQDPLSIWRSLEDDRVYVRPVTADTLLQVDTSRRALVEIPMNTDLTRADLDLIGGLEVGSIARVIGEQAARGSNPLLSVFLGDYRNLSLYGNNPLTVTLVDLVLPPAATGDNVLALLFIYDENRRVGRFVLTSGDTEQMVLSPDQQELLMRRYEGDEFIVRYEVESGQEINRALPALRAIGSYNRQAKNRVLAYDQTGAIVISDFQRLDAETFTVLAEDLRYSRVFDRFFFSKDSQKIITLAGTEWREWSIATGEVLRREVVNLGGEIVAVSPDGYRYLTQGFDSDGGYATVLDLAANERYQVSIQSVPGSFIENIYANPAWTRFLVVYSANPYGPYYPGNEIALYDYQEGLKWLIAGDDLPPNGLREYGWVDNETVFVYGQGRRGDQQARVYGVDYALNGLPACIASAFPDATDQFLRQWEQLTYYVWPDRLHEWSLHICANLPQSAAEAGALLQLTPTPAAVAEIGLPVGEVPQCLLDRYPGDAEAYTQIWRTLTADTSPEQVGELAVLLCEGIGPISESEGFDPSLGITMFIDAATGERSSGDYRQPVREQLPMGPVYELFEETEGRPLGTAILSPDRKLVAASSLPGELIIYRMIVTYQTLMSQLTATAAVQLAEANLVYALPSPSATYGMIGTPRPTLTPTPKQTLYPLPDEWAYANVVSENLCPSESLFSMTNPPASYDASGRIYAIVSDGPVWLVEPEDGTRGEAQNAIQCSRGVDCQFSPDKRWILAETYDLIYVSRPDNTDQRILWDLRTPNPPTPVPQYLYWAGRDTLEWEGFVPVTAEDGTSYDDFGYLRDVLNVFPDPRPWIPRIVINGIPAEFISRQPGGPWAVAYTTYYTGTGEGYKYYLYHTETGAYMPFAQDEYYALSIVWHPLGDRLFFRLNSRDNSPTYQITFPEIISQILGDNPGGVWSNNGHYRIYSTRSRAQPIAVQDSLTGHMRTYCLPETGARLYGGPFTWSPDNRYVALQAPLPRDEAQEGVGQHTLILNIETGEVVDLTTGILELIAWAAEPAEYGSGSVVTPTPSPTITLTPVS